MTLASPRILLPAAALALAACAVSPARAPSAGAPSPSAAPPVDAPPSSGAPPVNAPPSSAAPHLDAPPPAASARGGAVTVDSEAPPGQGSPAQSSIVAEMKRQRDRSRGCIKEPGALRTGRLLITIGASGRADRVVVVGHLEGTPEGACVATTFHDFRVPPFSGPPVTVRMSISLP